MPVIAIFASVHILPNLLRIFEMVFLLKLLCRLPRYETFLFRWARFYRGRSHSDWLLCGAHAPSAVVRPMMSAHPPQIAWALLISGCLSHAAQRISPAVSGVAPVDGRKCLMGPPCSTWMHAM